ncbi:MAG: PLP-dependent transferase, partial [Bdellovibrionaceae bacterium]|nr:PLP-dependent transferase [Pseudobdellovibrionaceae bacterium]
SLRRGAKVFARFGSGKETDSSPIWIYDRLEEPTTLMLESQVASMEGGECAVSFATGMGAISSLLLALTRGGDHILAHRTLYGCTYSLLTEWLPRFGVNCTIANLNSPEGLGKIHSPHLRVVYFETISNPSLEILDIKKIVNLVKKENSRRPPEERIFIVVDNTFATPWACRPLEWGVDFVVESLTKNISGFGTEMGGAVIGPKWAQHTLRLARKDFGAIIHPWSAWHIMVFGIPTQSLRFEEQQRSALQVAHFLERHPKVDKVIYPGLKSHPQSHLAKKYLRSPEGKFSPGTMISFVLKGGMKRTEKVVDHIAKNAYSITLAVSLGLTKTLIEVPGFMTHAAIPETKRKDSNIHPDLIRLSIGLEDPKDIISDLNSALSR